MGMHVVLALKGENAVEKRGKRHGAWQGMRQWACGGTGMAGGARAPAPTLPREGRWPVAPRLPPGGPPPRLHGGGGGSGQDPLSPHSKEKVILLCLPTTVTISSATGFFRNLFLRASVKKTQPEGRRGKKQL